ncbi:MFS transporter [Rubrivivax gelatinosus]|nr:MFS transporter [Rubrivivax gelatinosus]
MDWVFKVVLTAATVWVVMVVAGRSGRRLAGVAAALPTITAPTLAWLIHERGVGFAMDAAIASVSACAMLAIFTLGYALASRRRGHVCALLCGLAGGVPMLLAGRVLQGLGAALLVPQILATLHVSLRGAAHARAVALYGSLGGIAFIVGQVLGGALVTANLFGSGWRSVFLINLPVCALALASRRAVPETRAPRRTPLDLGGAALLTALLLLLMLPLALGPALGWPPALLAALAATVPLAVLLAAQQMREEAAGRQPLLPPSLLRLPGVRFALLLGMLFFACWSGFMFVLALALQAGAGLDAMQSGNCFIVLGAAYFASALASARLVTRFGALRMLLAGCALQMSGLALLAATLRLVWPHADAWNLAAATALVGAGQAQIVACFYRIGLAQLPRALAGAGSATLSTILQAALGLGPVLLGGVFVHVQAGAGGTLAGVQAALGVEGLVMAGLVLCTLALRRGLQAATIQPQATR